MKAKMNFNILNRIYETKVRVLYTGSPVKVVNLQSIIANQWTGKQYAFSSASDC